MGGIHDKSLPSWVAREKEGRATWMGSRYNTFPQHQASGGPLQNDAGMVLARLFFSLGCVASVKVVALTNTSARDVVFPKRKMLTQERGTFVISHWHREIPCTRLDLWATEDPPRLASKDCGPPAPVAHDSADRDHVPAKFRARLRTRCQRQHSRMRNLTDPARTTSPVFELRIPRHWHNHGLMRTTLMLVGVSVR